MEFVACCGTDIGIYRKKNQDAVSIRKNEIGGRQCFMAAVCDGVGGLSKGEYASRCMKERLERWFLYEFPQIAGQSDEEEIIKQRLKKIICFQNELLYEYGKQHGIRCATTVSVLVVSDEKYYIAHVGDSRIYLVTEKIRQLTEDQSFVAEALKSGKMSKEEIVKSGKENVILQSVGGDARVEVLTYCGRVRENSSFLVCSDGFYHHMDEDEIIEKFWRKRSATSRELGEKLVDQIDRLKKRGERDNISAAVIQISFD